MLRFKPDSWLEGVLRPFVMVDPQGFTYLEFPAPDLRFAVLALLTVAVLAAGRLRSRINAAGWRTLLGLWLGFYAWTFGIGNGRYFIAGLVVAGPLIVLLVATIPFTRPMRLLLLAGVIGLQAMMLELNFRHSLWAVAVSREAPILSPRDSPLRRQPAVFITTTTISHSLLVPQFHAASRWVNLAGQAEITPKLPEYARLQDLLASPLPRYVVVSFVIDRSARSDQPSEAALGFTLRTLARHGLKRDEQPCADLRSVLQPTDPAYASDSSSIIGYWVCPIQGGVREVPPNAFPPSHPWDDVFEGIEQRCPKFFPPGSGSTRNHGGIAGRRYQGGDIWLFIEGDGTVSFRLLRALNPTRIGDVEQVRRGDFAIDCHKLPGRYLPPWQRD